MCKYIVLVSYRTSNDSTMKEIENDNDLNDFLDSALANNEITKVKIFSENRSMQKTVGWSVVTPAQRETSQAGTPEG